MYHRFYTNSKCPHTFEHIYIYITRRPIVPYRSPPTGGGTFQANATRVESKIVPPSSPVCSFFRSVNASGFAPPRFSYEFGKTVTST